MHKDGSVVLIPLPDQQMRITVVVPTGKAAEWRKFSDADLMRQLAKRVPILKDFSFYREGEHIFKMVRIHPEYTTSDLKHQLKDDFFKI